MEKDCRIKIYFLVIIFVDELIQKLHKVNGILKEYNQFFYVFN